MINFRFLFIGLCLLGNGILIAQVRLCSWNLQNFGKTKSDTEIRFMAQTLSGFDVVAIQEVVAGYGGPQAVARLVDKLNRTGVRWDYVISDPTQSTPYASERYAFLWKPSKVKRIKKARLEHHYVHQIDREPFLITFDHKGELFTLVNFHAIPKKKQPETEIKYFKFLPALYPANNLIFLGDFNIPQSHTVFNPLKTMGYRPVFAGQRTTTKMECVEDQCLASEYDNIFYDGRKSKIVDRGVVHFYRSFPDMVSSRRISDHIPVWAEIDFSLSELEDSLHIREKR